MASIELKALHIERGICKRMLTNIERRVSETSSFTEQLIDVLLGEVQSTLNRFTPIQTQIEIFVDDDPKLKVHEENEGDSFNNRCVDLRLKLGHIAETCKGSSNGSLPQQEALDSSIADVLLKQTDLLDKIAEWQRSSPGATNSESSATRSKLPQLNLPSFDGKYIDWPQFRDAFENAIHNNDSLRDSEKMQYLKMYLTGGAAADISTIPISNQTYQSTWDSLKAQYNKKVHLVNAYIQQFMAQTQKKVENASDLQSASRRYKQIVDGLRALGPECFSLDMWLIYLMKLNMSENFRQEWEKGRSADQMSTIDEFFKFMSDVTDVMERASHGTSPAPPSVQKTTNKSNKSGFKTHHTNATKCPECEGEHALPQCEKFLALSLYERRERMAQHHLCYNCMKPHHSAAKCQSKGKCQKCGRRHHTLLHPPKMDPVPEEIDQSVKPQVKPVAAKEVVPQSQKTPEQSPTTSSTITTHHSAVHRKALLPTAIVNVRDVYGKYQACRVLIDGGGECTMMSEECAQRLALPRSKARIAVHGAGEVNVGYTRGLVHLEVVSRYDPNDKIEVQAYVMEKVTSKLPSVDLSGFKWDHIKSLQLADPQYTVPGKIDIILGAEYAFEINLPQTLKGDSGQPIAQLTIFGWIVGGRIDSPLNSITSLHTHYNLDEMLKRFWEVEESHLDKQPLLTEEEVMCEEHFTQTHSRDDTGRYVVKLPFKKDHKPLGNSSSTALARFQSLERKLSRDPDFHEQYKAFMGEYIGLNHMELVTGHDLKPEDESYFLPHQAVLRPTSETTKLRVVFDASATTRPNNPSLNDILAIGPTRQDDLLVLLLRFRTHKVAMSADVEKMYRQILVASEDRDYQRVFWRTNSQEKIQIFRLCTVTYGTSSAPFLAVRVLHQIAMDYKDDYPEACEVISTSFYMDDLLCGAESIEDGKKLQKEIQDVLGKGHFVLRKWASNSSEVLDQVPPDLQAITPDEVKAHTKSISALGLKWSPGPDNFSLVIDALPLVRTKRDLCAAAAKVFDPLGFICPVTINLKMMFQSLWLIPNLQWDDELPDDTAKSYERVQTEFSLIQKIVIPRAIPTQKDVIEIHGFADASERAYGAVIYAKGMDADGNIEINIVIAKSKVAPLKPITIPRMELNAAVLLTQLVTKVKDSLGNKMVEVHAWSDSTIVLQWLQEPPRTWNNYVARRVYAIQEVVPPTHWRHVPTAQNPADCISRGVSPKELSEHTLWWHGPQWLSENEEKWPENKVKRGKTGEERSSHAVSLVTQNQVDPLDLLIERTSGHLKTVRYLAYWLRFIGNLRVKKEERKTGFLTVSELQNATTCILKHIQQKVFPVEYKSCGQGHPLPRSSKLLKLVPFLDKDGLMRVQGRLANSNMDYSTQHPIILPSADKFVRDLIVFTHEMNLHAGPAILMNTLRTKYWILGLRNLVKGITRKCVKCIKAKPTTETPFMGDLPAARVQQNRPFYQTGCDFAGPIKIRASKLRKAPVMKAYICVFICMTTKAMHLEAVSDLTTDAFLASLRRFTARRGHCHTIFCDNGTNFLGASGTSREERLKGIRTHQHKVTSEMSGNGTRFSFIPAHSPTFGGLWERGVSSVKSHLRRVLGESLLTFEELATVLAQIEACLNSRPLCAKSSDIDDNEPLTPGHFLVGHAMNLTPGPDLLEVNPNRLSRWLLLQRMVQHFWKRWHVEYITSLQHRSKWYEKKRNLCVGDLVLLRDNLLKPTYWRMGRVTAVHPGKDDIVRVATVKTSDGMQKRAVNTLAWLPTDGFLSPSRTQEGENVGK